MEMRDTYGHMLNPHNVTHIVGPRLYLKGPNFVLNVHFNGGGVVPLIYESEADAIADMRELNGQPREPPEYKMHIF